MNRVVRATQSGFETEADPRRAELIVEQLDLQTAKGATTPGIDDPAEMEEHGDELLDQSSATNFRGLPARCNYLAADMPDIQFAVKELCREMSKPTSRSYARLNALGAT